LVNKVDSRGQERQNNEEILLRYDPEDNHAELVQEIEEKVGKDSQRGGVDRDLLSLGLERNSSPVNEICETTDRWRSKGGEDVVADGFMVTTRMCVCVCGWCS
jgi:hypothetical protein